MLMHGVYSDALSIHTPSKMDPLFPDVSEEESIGNTSFLSSLSDVKEDDPRKNLNDTWLKWKKFQPLWKIRNYFGEQIALYFAWLGKYAKFVLYGNVKYTFLNTTVKIGRNIPSLRFQMSTYSPNEYVFTNRSIFSPHQSL